MENKLPTAEEFQKILLKERGRVSEYDFMIEFAKLHVTEALKQASEQVKTKDDIAIFAEGSYIETVVDKNSILNAYSLDNIK